MTGHLARKIAERQLIAVGNGSHDRARDLQPVQMCFDRSGAPSGARNQCSDRGQCRGDDRQRDQYFDQGEACRATSRFD